MKSGFMKNQMCVTALRALWVRSGAEAAGCTVDVARERGGKGCCSEERGRAARARLLAAKPVFSPAQGRMVEAGVGGAGSRLIERAGKDLSVVPAADVAVEV
ncbi:hypothetical protein CP980_34870 [Streptomyces vinaceus]|uniref:Uncharacterized protein n=1 Tax=Streptomyces vinaceus TaxID=1960 RepID=A0A5J6JIH7_STRVI|nr:hypothetical protein CP980_34870 [Streptomyces vinaceus]GHE46310.1 hypothetical protein GCM10017778_32780 [Streptomyces vinaceus]